MADSQNEYKLSLVGLRLKTALSTAIYKKSLKLSNSSRKDKTGEFELYLSLVQRCEEVKKV